MATIDKMQTSIPIMTSSDLSSARRVASASALSITSGKSLDEIGTTAGLPVQTSISDIEGSVDFISTTDDAFTSFTNPASALGLSTLAPEIIGSFDFVPLYKDSAVGSEPATVNANVYNAIYQNMLFDSLTREAARNCLQALIKNEGDVVDTLISSISETSSPSFTNYSEFMAGLTHIGHYSYFVRRLMAGGGSPMAQGIQQEGSESGWYDGYALIYSMFDSLRSALNFRNIAPSSSSCFAAARSLGITDNQGFSISNEIGDFDTIIDILQGVCGYEDSELTAASNTRQVAQIVQDLRRSILLAPIGASDSRSSDIEEPYIVIDDMGDEDTQYAFAEILSGLNSLNTTSESSGTDVGTISESDFTSFRSSATGLEFFKRATSICALITRDVNLSFRKRTQYVLESAASITEDTAGVVYGSGKNPGLRVLIDDTVGNIGGDLLSSSPATESIASLLNPDTGDGSKILSFEKFSVDSSFGDGIAGFDAFSGDLVNWLENMDDNGAGLGFLDFANDFKSKADSLRKMVPILIGGARGSNSLWRNLTKYLANYLMKQGFFSDYTSSSALGGTASGVTIGESDALEFVRFGIVVTAADNSEVGYLLTKYLDLRNLAKKMSLLPTIAGSGSGVLSSVEGSSGITSFETDENISAIEQSYDQFYSAAKDLAQKIIDVTTTNDVVNALLLAADEDTLGTGTRLYKESATQSVATTIDTFRGEPYDVDADETAQSNIDIMETPVGLALMTLSPESGNESIFDIPQIVLDSFYEDLVEKNMVSSTGSSLTGTSLTLWDIMRLNRATSSSINILTPGSGEFSDEYVETLKTMQSGIETDYRGWSDSLRRRAIMFLISDILSEFTDSQMLIGMDVGDFAVTSEDSSKSATKSASYAEQVESSGGGPPGQIDAPFGGPVGKAATVMLSEYDTSEANLDITSNVFLKFDSSKTTQLLAIMRDLNDDSKVSDETTSVLSGAGNDEFDGEIFTETNSQIKKTHLALLNTYFKTETLAEALYDIGTSLASAAGEIQNYRYNADVEAVFSLFDLMAKNATTHADAGTMSTDDIRSAIISTSMFPETLSLRAHLDEQEYRRGARAGFFDDEISPEGVQPSSTALLIPRGSVIESSFLSKRVIPSLGMMTIKGREQLPSSASEQTKSGIISIYGDPNDDRKEIVTIGIPVGLTERLREEAASYASEVAGYGEESYEESPLICIKIYKKDLDRGDVVYIPQSYVFDTRVMGICCPTVSTDTSYNSDIGGIEKIQSDIISQAMAGAGDGETENHTSHWKSKIYSGYDLDGDGSAITEVGQDKAMSMTFDEEFTYSDADQYDDLFNDVIFSLLKVKPLRGYSNKPLMKHYYTLPVMFPSDPAEDVRKNHLNDVFIKHYLKITAGIDVSEKAFPLFRNGTSPMSSTDGAGLGTASRDFEFIDNMMQGLNRPFSEEFISDDYIQNVRSDILKLVDEGIKSNALGSFDVDESISSNVIAKLKQSYLFSAEKYFNQTHLPHLFERVFCVMIDPDGFDIDLEETTGIDTSDDDAVQSYITEVYNIFATIEILPVSSGDGVEMCSDSSVGDLELDI